MEPSQTPQEGANQNFRKGIFISYSHRDEEWSKRLIDFLKPVMRDEDIHVWSDKNIDPGMNWKNEIIAAIYRARVAVLLVSQNFISSAFIYKEELPRILAENVQRGLTIIWIAVSHSTYKFTPLGSLQAAHEVSHPLDSLPKPEQDRTLVSIVDKIVSAMDLNAVANTFHIIDSFYPEQIAFTQGQEELMTFDRPGTIAVQHQTTLKFENRQGQVVESITREEIEKLDAQSVQLVHAYENTMQDLFDRWTELKPKRVARDAQVREKARIESEELRRDLCTELNGVLDFINELGKHLEDHYHYVRHICNQPAKGLGT